MRRVLRYIFPGGTPKSGRVVDLGEGDTVGVDVISALAADGVDFARFDVRVYDDLVGGWRRLSDDECPSPECWTTVREGELVRCEFSLERKPEPRASTSELPPFERVLDASAASTLLTPPPGAQDGFFGIGIYNCKTATNLGTLWRSAYQLGASFVFVIGDRFKKEATDTAKSWTQIPAFEFKDWNEFAEKSPVSAVWVGVEMGGTPLEEFEHPRSAVYILGSEDNGLNTTMLRACRHHVALPTCGERSASYNVAVTGAVLMYDREAKRRVHANDQGSRIKLTGREGVDSIKYHRLGKSR